MVEKTDGQPAICSLSICPNHPNTVERLAMLEKGMASAEDGISKAVERLDEVRDITMAEFRAIRESITNGIMKRHSPAVTAIISVLTGLCCALLAVLFTYLLSD